MIPNVLPQSLVDNPLLSQWVAFEQGRRVRIATGKVEIGQGILTALVQIAAEELDVAPAQLRIVSGETDVSPSEGFTSGSYSIAVGGASLRLACAEVRSLFLERAAGALGCPAAELSIADGKFLRAGRETGRDYWSMAGEVDLHRRTTGTAPVKLPSHYRIVGRNLPRLDLPAKLVGAAFIHDIAPEDVLHARVLRQPWRGARLLGLDERAVRKAANAALEILREGDFVAFVAASELAVMRAGAAARNLARWEGGEPVPDQIGDPAWLMAQPQHERTVASAPRGAPQGRVVEARYSRPFLTYGSIGCACALAEFRDGRLTVWSHSQGPAVLRDWLARALGLQASQVTVRHRQGAGAYGHNTADDAAFDAAFIATLRPGRTVRVQWAREDEFLAAPISTAMAIKLSAVLDDDGRPADWSIEIWSPPHAQRPGMNGNSNLIGAEALPNARPRNEPGDVPDERGGGATRNAIAIYDLPRHRLIHHLLPRVPLRTSSLRGLGAWANVFAIESFIDELAELAGEDPVRYRLSLLSDPRARRVVETVARISGWFETGPLPEGARARGMGFARYKNLAAFAAVVAEVEIDQQIRLARIWCCADAGLVISPDGARNQIEGGIIQGASFALKERVRFESGRVAATTWQDYPILRFSEIPEIAIELIEAPNEPALGLGEAAVGPTVAAIGNAVARALGKRIRDLPLTRERIAATLLAD